MAEWTNSYKNGRIDSIRTCLLLFIRHSPPPSQSLQLLTNFPLLFSLGYLFYLSLSLSHSFSLTLALHAQLNLCCFYVKSILPLALNFYRYSLLLLIFIIRVSEVDILPAAFTSGVSLNVTITFYLPYKTWSLSSIQFLIYFCCVYEEKKKIIFFYLIWVLFCVISDMYIL